MFNLSKIEKLLLSATGGVALVLGFISYLTITVSEVPSPVVQETKDSQRRPASFVKVIRNDQNIVSKDARMASVDLKCLLKNRVLNFDGKAKLLQLKGQLCGMKAVSKIEVLNRTNGVKATIFPFKNNRFMTDYISIAPGKNQLLVRAKDVSGEKILNNVLFVQKNL